MSISAQIVANNSKVVRKYDLDLSAYSFHKCILMTRTCPLNKLICMLLKCKDLKTFKINY